MRTAHVSRHASRSVTQDGEQILILSPEAFKAIRTAAEHGKGALQDNDQVDNAICVEALACIAVTDAWPGADDLMKTSEHEHEISTLNASQRGSLSAFFDEQFSSDENSTYTIKMVDGFVCVDGQYLSGSGAWVDSIEKARELSRVEELA